ncbi:GNAT family N-acetyltransferase [Ancylobacter mangrovi]|uniref:GNAT family N-acetyltransferase n=1 Tax=Ancylobacter mangrovi TaxID=2972472 RepID=UPI0021639C3D|nr:GNAT family N-acetyltransferase [Ancylobacter mangrovi]MCS0504406.1 GNAT family N-acetyltransferase [Ancylobacter mangrovi]
MTTSDHPAKAAPTLELNGYTPLPAGSIAAVVTFMEMKAPSPPLPEKPGHSLVLEKVPSPDPRWYRALFRRVGERWLWFSRLEMDEAALGALLADPMVGVYVLKRAGVEVGLLELDFRRPGEVELAFFGVVPEMVGSGAGSFMMNRALALAWAADPRRVHVHTCTLDMQGAVEFYRRAGFVPYARAIEVARDPRLSGLLAADAAPHAPLID